MASLGNPQAMAVGGAGDLYVAVPGRIRVIDGTTAQIDGFVALDAQSMVVDTASSALYVYGAAQLRRVSLRDRSVTVVAGTGLIGDGTGATRATQASLPLSARIASASDGTILIASSDLLLRYRPPVGTSTPTVERIAGGALVEGPIAAGDPTRVAITGGVVAVDSGVVIAEARRLRRIAADGTSAELVVGSVARDDEGRSARALSLGRIRGVSTDDQGRLYAVEEGPAARVLRVDRSSGLVTIIAGGRTSTQADGALAINARLSSPGAVAALPGGGVAVSDGASLRVVDAAGVISTVATAAGQITGIAAAGDGRIYFATPSANQVMVWDPGTEDVAVAAGVGAASFGGDGGLAPDAALNAPLAVAVAPNGDLLIADSANRRVRRVYASTGTIATVAGDGSPGPGGDGGPAMQAQLTFPTAVAVTTEGRVVVADVLERRIRVIDADGTIDTVVGVGDRLHEGVALHDAMIDGPSAVAVDSIGNIFITQGARVLRADALTQSLVTTLGSVDASGDGLLTHASLEAPEGLIGIDAQRVLVADKRAGRLRMIDRAAGLLATVVGVGGGLTDDGAEAGLFRLLRAPMDMAYDRSRWRLYATEADGRILLFDTRSVPWTVSTLIGSADGAVGYREGPAADARFERPSGIAFDRFTGTVYVADSETHVVRALATATLGTPTRLVAGEPGVRGYSGDEGAAVGAWLDGPTGVAVGPDRSVYVADTNNHRIRRIEANGRITTVIGDGSPSSASSGAPASQLAVDSPSSLEVDAWGNLFFVSRTSVRVVFAGEDGVATGADQVATLWVPELDVPLVCLAGIELLGTDAGRVLVTDRCAGAVVELVRQP